MRNILRAVSTAVALFAAVIFFVIAQVAWAGFVYRPPIHIVLLGLLFVGWIVSSVAVINIWRNKTSSIRAQWISSVVVALLFFCFVAQLLALSRIAPSVFALYLGAIPGQFLVVGGVGIVFSIFSLLRRMKLLAVSIGLSTGIIIVSSGLVVGSQLLYASKHGVAVSTPEILSNSDPSTPPTELKSVKIDETELGISIWHAKNIQSTQPAIILIHGGGYGAGTSTDMKNLGTYLSNRGYPVFSVDYRLAPPERWYDATNDVVAMMQWIQDHASEYKADMNRSILIGTSAGGGLSLNVGYGLAQRGVSSSLGGSLPPTPIGVVGLYPAADLRGIYNSTEFQDPRPLIEQFTGGTPNQVPSHYDYADPSAKIKPELMPTLLMTGAHDHLIYKETVTGFADKMRQNGNRVESYVLPFADHTFDAVYNSPASAIERGLLTRWLDKIAPLK